MAVRQKQSKTELQRTSDQINSNTDAKVDCASLQILDMQNSFC